MDNSRIYDEILEVFEVFRFDLTDAEVEQVRGLLNHSDRYDSDFMCMLNEVFTKVVASSDQKLIVRYFKEAFGGSNLYSIGENMHTWVKRNI